MHTSAHDNNNDGGAKVIGLTMTPLDGSDIVDDVYHGHVMHNNNNNNNNDNKKDEAYLSLQRTNSTRKFVHVLVFGLLLYVLDVGLHLAIASNYLSMRDCHRGVSHTFHDFNLADLAGLNNSEGAGGDEWSARPTVWGGDADEQDTASPVHSFLQPFLADKLYFRVRHKLVSLVPEHWVQRIRDIVSFQLGRYRPSHVARLCRFNGRSFDNAVGIGLYVCRDALAEEQRQVVQGVFRDMPEEQEDAVLSAAMAGDQLELAKALAAALGIELDPKALKVVKHFSSQLTEEDLAAVFKLLEDEEVVANIIPMMDAMGRVDPADMEQLGKAFGKVDPQNIPKIDKLLAKLNVSMASFITDPSLFVKFLRDPKLSAVLIEVQGLLPTFEPHDLNAMLKVKKVFEAVPGAAGVLEKVMAMPMGTLLKILSVEVTPEERESLKKLGAVMESEKAKELLPVLKDLQLMSGKGREALMHKCGHDVLRVTCEDPSVDMCPNGHWAYGLATLAALSFPGVLLAVSEFRYFRAFRFGTLFGRMYGQQWNRVFKWALLPLYMLAMIPLTLVVTIVQYYRVLSKIFHQKSPLRVQEHLDDALNLHSLEASGNAFFQVVFQLFFLLLLVAFGAGTIVAGIDVEQFFASVVPLTVISVTVSLFSSCYVSYELQSLDHRVKGLPHVKQTSALKNVLTFALWFAASHLAQVLSLVLLALVVWIEVFSGDLLRGHSGVFSVHSLPVLVLLMALPVNAILHRKYVKSEDAYSRAHGVLSAVFPARYLHPTNRTQTKKFLLANQITLFSLHLLAWLIYSLAVLHLHDEEAGLLRIVPVILALVGLAVFLASVRWAVVLRRVYEATSQIDLLRQPQNDVRPRPRPRGMPAKYLYIFWQVCTVLTRLASLVLLTFVYYKHWLVVGGSLKFSLLVTTTYLLLLVVSNVGLHLAKLGPAGGGGPAALLACLLPNSFLLKGHTAAAKVAKYIVLNMALNLLLHLVLWLALTFYCWECTKVLDTYFRKLSLCFPVAVGLWVFDLVLTLVCWRVSIRRSLEEVEEDAEDADENTFERAWSAKTSSVTTKF